MRRFLFWLSSFLPCRIIDVDGNPYLERYYIAKFFGITFYLHRFISGDGDREVHNHPWNKALAIVLVGGYKEERVVHIDSTGWISKDRTLFPGRFNYIPCNAFHRIANAKPETWTLFIHSSRTKNNKPISWGFLKETDSGLLLYQPYDVSIADKWWHKVSVGRLASRWPLGKLAK